MHKVSRTLDLTPTNADTAQVVSLLTDYVTTMRQLNHALAAAIALTSSTVVTLDALAEKLRMASPDGCAAQPPPALPTPVPLTKPCNPPFRLLVDPSSRRLLEFLFSYPQSMVDATVAALSEGVPFRNQPALMQKELILQYGASLVEALGHPPTQVDFDNRRPAWMPMAMTVVTTLGQSWDAWLAAFASRAAR